MADLSYAVNVNTKGAQQSLDNLQKRVKTSTGAFDGLKKAVAGLAVAAFVRSSFQMANAMTDLSAATNVSVKSLLGFGQAMAANGGSIQKSEKAVQELTKRMGEAQQGSAEAVASFQRVGVSLQEIHTLSEEDILRKVVDSLGKMDSPSKRAAASMRIFSNAVKGVDFVGLNNGLDNYTQRSAGYAAAVERAGQVNQSLKNIMEELRVRVLAALDPFTRFVESLLSSKEALDKFMDSWVVFAIKMSAALVVGAAITKIVVALGGALVSLSAAAMGIVRVWGVAINSMKNASQAILGGVRSAGNFTKTIREAAKAFLEFLKNDAGAWASGAVRAIATATAAAIAFKDSISDWLDNVETRARALGFLPKIINDASGQIQMMASHSADATAEFLKQRDAAAKLVEYIGALEVGFSKALATYKQQNAETIKGLELTKKMIGMTSEQAEKEQILYNFSKRRSDELAVLKERLELLKKSQGDHTAEIALTEQAITQLNKEYYAQLPLVTALAEQIAEKRKEVEKELEAAHELTRLAEETADAIKDSSRFMERLTESTQDARDAIEDLKFNELEKSVRVNARNIRNNLAKEVKKLQDLIKEGGDEKSLNAQIKALEAHAEATIKTQDALIRKSHEYQRSFAYGWKKAFEQYKDDATNAAMQANRVFTTATKNMEDTLVNFVKTGKFEWRGLANSILEEILRIQIQKTIAGIGTKMAGSSFAGFFANGGTIPAGKYGVVGEAGPELVSGPATVTPQDQLSGTNITYNINAVDAASFKTLVARDPGFIYAVTEQGRKRATGGR